MHEHPDHISGLGEVLPARKVPSIAHAAGKETIESFRKNWKEWDMDAMSPAPPIVPETFVADGAEMTVGKLTLKALHAPGHAPGSLCYLLAGRFLGRPANQPGERRSSLRAGPGR